MCVPVHNQPGIAPRFFASLRMTLHDRQRLRRFIERVFVLQPCWSPRFSIRLALKALSHVSLGHRPRNSNRRVKSALKARFNRAGSDSRFQRWCLGNHKSWGDAPGSCVECCAFGAERALFEKARGEDGLWMNGSFKLLPHARD